MDSAEKEKVAKEKVLKALSDVGVDAESIESFDDEALRRLSAAKFDTRKLLMSARPESLAQVLAPALALVDCILEARGAAAAAAGPGPGSTSAGGPPLKKAKMEECSPSVLASGTAWQKYAWNPASLDPAANLERAAFFGFRPAALPPAVIPPQLAAPEFFPILQAGLQAACPPPNFSPLQHGPLLKAAERLLALSSRLHEDEDELKLAFLNWHNDELGLGPMMLPLSRSSSSLAAVTRPPAHDGMLTTGDKDKFVVSLLKCKSGTAGGEPLIQALMHYQMHYGNGSVWERSPLHCAGTLPTLVLLLEGRRLSFHAVWTLYQNRVAYTPLTPSFYLANEPGFMANLWRLVAVLDAYQRTVRGLKEHYKALEALDPQRCQAMAGLRQAACLVVADGQQVERPCTLPYSLLDEKLGLKDVSWVGPDLLYAATQRVQGGAGERAVLIKFVEGRYGQEVHAAWHSVGVAPALHSATLVGGGSMTMVVMEHLRAEDGWTALSEVPRWDRGQQLQAAVRDALGKAHAVQLGCGHGAAHGDVRSPNILVRRPEGGGSTPEVRIIDFDWAGADGIARYPLLLLSPDVKWHPDVRPGGTIHQAHDRHLLDNEFLD